MPEETAKPSTRAARRRELNRRLRLAFLTGAEERSRETLDRGLADDELRRIIERHPGDLKGG